MVFYQPVIHSIFPVLLRRWSLGILMRRGPSGTTTRSLCSCVVLSRRIWVHYKFLSLNCPISQSLGSSRICSTDCPIVNHCLLFRELCCLLGWESTPIFHWEILAINFPLPFQIRQTCSWSCLDV